MKGFSRHILLWLLLVCAPAVSCRKPDTMESFCRVEMKQDGMYRFEVDMTDSLRCYDIDFYARVDGRSVYKAFPLDVEWVSPSGLKYGERVYFRPGPRKSRSAMSRQLIERYRTGIEPVEPGIWKIGIAADTPGLRGIGIVFRSRERQWDTTN